MQCKEDCLNRIVREIGCDSRHAKAICVHCPDWNKDLAELKKTKEDITRYSSKLVASDVGWENMLVEQYLFFKIRDGGRSKTCLKRLFNIFNNQFHRQRLLPYISNLSALLKLITLPLSEVEKISLKRDIGERKAMAAELLKKAERERSEIIKKLFEGI